YITLDAGVAEWYLWSDGSTDQYLTVDSLTFGIGVHTISVIVGNGGCTATDTVTITIDYCPFVDEIAAEIVVSLYPNPNRGRFNLVVENVTADVNIELYDMTGKVVVRETITENDGFRKEFDVTTYPKGLYFLRMTSGEFVKVEKVVIQ
ncbi:MAG: T9SS type A sorting domain-containing protein, partial [Bacteroidetes bacterium]|nr:T9SS type A sorting domain-containing protein [Bacteroidota bacterium]